MDINIRTLKWYLMFKLPSAFVCGVRLKQLSEKKAVVSVKYNWFTKNPFRSLYFAVQSMAAELSTGVLVISKIKNRGQSMAMLITHHEGSFLKKARGRIVFSCEDGLQIDEVIEKAVASGEGEKIYLKAVGRDAIGDIVSEYVFEWSIKLRSKE